MRRKIVVSGVAMVAMTTAGMLTALAPAVSASTGGVIKVAYENYGTNITLNTLMQKAGAQFREGLPGLDRRPRAYRRGREPLLHQARPHEPVGCDGP